MEIGKRIATAALCIVFLFGVMLCGKVWTRQTVQTAAQPSAPTYILIDPGHGGEDGGATSADGILEKDVNLSIARDLADLLRIFGLEVKMTRDTDCSLTSEGTTVRARKVSDMQNRLTGYNAAGFTVGIHQNYFTQTKYSGAQIFCAADEESAALGEAIRLSVVGTLQPDNRRERKTASGDIFLLHQTQRPAVIVECGFLSNVEECHKLCDTDYQHQMAAAIAAGICKYTAEE